MSYSVCCMTSQLQTDLENLEMTDTNYTAIMNFRKQLVELYSSYRSKKRLFKLLRGLQIAGGFMITTLTTYNNPYFKENSESIGILVWYISITNNIVNLLTEKLGGYDLSSERIKIRLMIDEANLYNKNEKNYSFYSGGIKEEKLEYFTKMYKMIIQSSDPFTFINRNEKNAEHNSKIMETKTKRLDNLWRGLTPPSVKKNQIVPDELIPPPNDDEETKTMTDNSQ